MLSELAFYIIIGLVGYFIGLIMGYYLCMKDHGIRLP